MMPMGVFFSPTPSILFSSLFFMLRSLREAWIKITTGTRTGNYFISFFFKCENRKFHVSNLIDDFLLKTSRKIRERTLRTENRYGCNSDFKAGVGIGVVFIPMSGRY